MVKVLYVSTDEELLKRGWLILWPWRMNNSQVKRLGGKMGKSKFQLRQEVGLSCGKVECPVKKFRELSALLSSIPHIAGGGPIPCSVFSKASV